MQNPRPKRDDVLELSIDHIDARGHAVAEYEGHQVRLRGAAPGSRVRAVVRKRRRSKVDAILQEVLEPGPDQVTPQCAHFGTCGGCSFQHIDYAAQLRFLGDNLRALLEPLGSPEVQPVLGARSPWHYRNKMDFTFGSKRWIEPDEPEGAPNGFALGLHVPGRFDKILSIGRCEIAFPEANSLLEDARELAQKHGLDAWDVREHRGLLRHLVLRKGFRTGEVMVDLVTTELATERLAPFLGELLEKHPEVTTLVQRVNSGVALIASGEEYLHHGAGTIHEELAGLSFRISPPSFFQTNTEQAEELVRIVKERALVGAGTRVFDLYCGSGLFSLSLAREGARVTGYELVQAAIDDARLNAERNGIEAVSFVAGDLAETLDLESVGEDLPEVCVVDPPRAGMHPKVLGVLRRLKPQRIVYVSCNPKTALVDIEHLLLDGYRIAHVEPVDLFPHTPHLECVFTLEAGNA